MSNVDILACFKIWSLVTTYRDPMEAHLGRQRKRESEKERDKKREEREKEGVM